MNSQRLLARASGYVAAVFAGCILAGPAALAAESVPALFYRGNDYMRQGDFSRAAATYESIVTQGWESGAVYYNLGNAYVKQGKLGKALLNYERARRLIPRDSDLKANREFARNALAMPIPEPASHAAAALLRRIASLWTLAELLYAGLALYWLLAGLVVLRIFTGGRNKGLRPATVVVGGAVLALSLACGVTCYDEHLVSRGIITVAQAEGRFGPDSDATVYFRLYEGTPVRIIERGTQWLRVKTPDAQYGWIPAKSLEEIAVAPPRQ